MKLAILQMSDTPQIESSAQMLRHAGYDVKVCGRELREELKRIGCDTVLSVDHMLHLGYDALDPSIGEASVRDMDRADLFCEIKVRNVDRIRNRWPRLRDRIAWWRVNGAQPEICPRGGDEVNLTCPVITACLWYGTATYRIDHGDRPDRVHVQKLAEHEHPQNQPVRDHGPVKLGDNGLAYVMWPPYPRAAEYLQVDRSRLDRWFPPYSLCHWGRNWGYGDIVDECVAMGVRFYGNASPAGQIQHSQVPQIAGSSLCLVHLKSVDCPGWALYEALLSGCPVVTGRMLRSRMLAGDLLRDGETCFEFGVTASLEYGRGPMEPKKCLEDIRSALAMLKVPDVNRSVGQAGRERLLELMWKPQLDGDGFRAFLGRHFG